MTPDPAAVVAAAGTASQATPASPPPAPAPQTQPAPPAPTLGSGPGSSGAAAGPGVTTPAPGASGQPAALPTPPADWQQQLAQIGALRQQAQEYQQYKHLIPLGYAAYQRQAQAQPQPAPAPGQPQPQVNPFGLPQFDYQLLNFIGKDERGQLTLLPGAPPDALHRYQDYQAKLQDAQRNFWSDPAKVLAPMIQAEAKKIAAEVYQQNFQGHQQQQTSAQILQQNADWLYAKDQAGQPQTRFDPMTGQSKPVLSEMGQAYARIVGQLESAGVKDPAMQNQLAVAQLQNMVFQAQQRQAQAGAAGQQQQAGFINGGAGNPPVTVPTPSTVTPPPPAGFSLRERMKQQMDAAGLSEAVLLQQVMRPAAA